MNNLDIASLKFNKDGLIPAIVQDKYDKAVLMLAYMNAESLKLTLETGYTHFYSRSREKLWKKGEESGNVQKVTSLALDCDDDTILVTVIQTNDIACHTGNRSCFYKKIIAPEIEVKIDSENNPFDVFDQLYNLIQDRKSKKPEGSYVSYLFEKGQDKILKKIGEEAGEVIIGSKNNDKDEIIYEMADLWFHSLVALGLHNISPEEIMRELVARHGKASMNK